MDKRIYWLDAARAIAIILVVFTHSHEQAWVSDPLLASVFYTVDRLGVPIFFMISGGLILDKIKNVDLAKFYKKRIVQFLILLVTYSILTNVVMVYFETGNIYTAIVKSAINFNGVINTDEKLGIYGGARQLWFMYVIIQLYLVAPFVSKMLSETSTQNIIVFAMVCALLSQVRVTLFTFGFEWRFLGLMGQDFTGAYVLYFILGYLVINRGVLSGFNKIILSVLSLALIIIPSWLLINADVSSGKLIASMHWYSGSLPILLSSFGLFVLIKLIFDNRRFRVLELLSLCSFGIYLIHYAVLYAVKFAQLSYLPSLSVVEKTLIYFMASLLISVIFVLIMMRHRMTRYFVS